MKISNFLIVYRGNFSHPAVVRFTFPHRRWCCRRWNTQWDTLALFFPSWVDDTNSGDVLLKENYVHCSNSGHREKRGKFHFVTKPSRACIKKSTSLFLFTHRVKRESGWIKKVSFPFPIHPPIHSLILFAFLLNANVFNDTKDGKSEKRKIKRKRRRQEANRQRTIKYQTIHKIIIKSCLTF